MKKSLLFMGALLFLSGVSQAQSWSNIERDSKVRIGVRSNAAPFSFLKNGEGQGYVVELCLRAVQDWEKKLGKPIAVEFVEVSAKNRFELLNENKIDMECGVTTVTAARREKAEFSHNTFITSTRIVTLSQNKINQPRDFYEAIVKNGKSVAIMKGTSHESMLKKWTHENKFNSIEVDSIEEGLKKVLQGEAFGFIQDKALIDRAILASSMDKKVFSFSEDSLSLEPYSIMVKKGDKVMLNTLNNSLFSMYKSGAAKNSLKAWLNKSGVEANYLTLESLRNPSTENAVPE